MPQLLGNLVDESELIELLGVHRNSLYAWRNLRRDPLPHVICGSRRVKYHLPTVERWLANRSVGFPRAAAR
jgi:predicted DNA-binding transcriptional regulator AlpA